MSRRWPSYFSLTVNISQLDLTGERSRISPGLLAGKESPSMRQETNTRRRLFAFIAAFAAAAGWAAAQARGPEVLGFKKQFIVEITNPSPLPLENHALVIDVADIRASVAADFNTYYYAFFEEKGGEYALVVSQADDLDKDRNHDEIVLVRTLPPSTTRLVCYYTPGRSFQLMPTHKAFARPARAAGGPA